MEQSVKTFVKGWFDTWHIIVSTDEQDLSLQEEMSWYNGYTYTQVDSLKDFIWDAVKALIYDTDWTTYRCLAPDWFSLLCKWKKDNWYGCGSVLLCVPGNLKNNHFEKLINNNQLQRQMGIQRISRQGLDELSTFLDTKDFIIISSQYNLIIKCNVRY